MKPAYFALSLALFAAAPAHAQGLTVGVGETWIFVLAKGQPAKARKVKPSASAKRGEIKVSVRSMLGTTMTINGNVAMAYTYKASLVGAGGKPIPARSCTLPANNQLSFEHWPQQAQAVRLSDFKPAPDGGNCP